ncbi:MAG: hypothetical protein WA705_24265 [Candidatus Ozemobacteraceae bacterium]
MEEQENNNPPGDIRQDQENSDEQTVSENEDASEEGEDLPSEEQSEEADTTEQSITETIPKQEPIIQGATPPAAPDSQPTFSAPVLFDLKQFEEGTNWNLSFCFLIWGFLILTLLA